MIREKLKSVEDDKEENKTVLVPTRNTQPVPMRPAVVTKAQETFCSNNAHLFHDIHSVVMI